MEVKNADSNIRQAVVFKPPENGDSKKNNGEDDDSFYELTMDEMMSLYSQFQKQKAMNDKFLPREKREEEERALLPPVRSYDQTVVRIEFPDRTTLQGTFRTDETISDVKEFVRHHLNTPSAVFEIFTSPPKNVPPDDSTLADLKFVPTAKFYVVAQNAVELRCVQTSIVSFESAQETASVFRKPKEVEQLQPTPSCSKSPVPAKPKMDDEKAKKIPKWFKTKK